MVFPAGKILRLSEGLPRAPPEPFFDFYWDVCYHSLFMRQRTAMSAPARRKPCRLVLCSILISLSAGVAMAQSLDKLNSILPPEGRGWKKDEPAETTNKK